MNKTIERLITAGMIAVLVTAFFQVADATNESSYKYGYQQDFDADCNAAPDDCQPTVYESTNGDFNGVPVSPASVDVHNASYYYLH